MTATVVVTDTDRACSHANCPNPVRRRRGDSDAQFAKRQFCSLACYRAHVHVERPSRTCEVCGEPFGPSARERPSQFVKRNPRFCSQACHGRAGRAEHATPHCRICDVEIAAQPGDTPGQHAHRRRCPEHLGIGTGSPSTSRRPKAARKPKPAPRPREVSPFGDRPPAQPWRPPGFSASPRTSRLES